MWIEGNKENVERVAGMLSRLCGQLKNGEVRIGDVPLDAVINFIAKIYDEGEGAAITILYAKILADCVSQGNTMQLANVIELICHHAIMIQCFEENQHFLGQMTFWLQSSNAWHINRGRIEEWQARHGSENESGRIPFNGRGVVYSAVTGGYDRIYEPQYVNPQLDYILFTDNPDICSDVWQIRLISNPENLDNTRLARRIKILGYQYLKEYDYSVWVDGKMAITGDLQDFICKNRGSQPMLCFNHPAYDCIYKEKERCEEIGKDNPAIMLAQVERYREEGYPAHNGLIESAVLVRELKDDRVVRLMEAWWQEVLHGSKRDQLSFNYVCWKNDFVYDSTDLYINANNYVKLCGHRQ